MAQKKAKKAKCTSKKTGGKGILRILGKIVLILFLLSLFFPLLYRWVNPIATPLMLIRKVKGGAAIQKEWVDMDQISPNLVVCAIAAEDNNFLGHNGFDYGAIERAQKENEKGRRLLGASTISQQTAKNVFLWPKRSFIRKGMEVYFTFLIEHFWSKERIMEVYLNVIEMGDGIYGCEAASQRYFHKPAVKLSRYEAALITACYPAPLKRNPGRPSAYLAGRAVHISGLSYKFGRISFTEESIHRAQERYHNREEKRIARGGKRWGLF